MLVERVQSMENQCKVWKIWRLYRDIKIFLRLVPCSLKDQSGVSALLLFRLGSLQLLYFFKAKIAAKLREFQTVVKIKENTTMFLITIPKKFSGV